MSRLEQLKAAHAASAQGEWETSKGQYGVYVTTKRDPNLPSEPSNASCYGKNSKENARAIALSHNLMPDLLEAVECIEHVLIASEDGGDMSDIDWERLQKLWKKFNKTPEKLS